MKEIRNYKNIRRKPELFGFSPNAFYLFVGVLAVSLMTLTTGFSWLKILIIICINVINLIFTKLIVSNDHLMRKVFNEKFPSQISALTRNTKNNKTTRK